jgi:LuxR family transcriptional regulator, maltose regulon positive regulatory protein
MPKPDKPIVQSGRLLVTGSSSGAAKIIPLDSPRWRAWLNANTSFIFEGGAGHFSAQREKRRGTDYWYGYRRRGGKLFKVYLGKSGELSQERLEQASAQLAGQSPVMSYADTTTGELPIESRSALEAVPILTILPLTKLKPPTLPEKIIERPRLTQRIKSPVTFIYAPSGFGKSTLLNEWRQICGVPVAWASLDADDDQPARFWFTVASALQTIDSTLGQTLLARVSLALSSSLFQVALDFANEIVRAPDAAGSAERLALVLDDYHHIQHQAIHESIQTLLEHLPPNLQLIISSRTRPPFAVGHLRAKGLVTELETDDLRFTLEEGVDFLWQYMPERRLAYTEMQTLVKHTEGWVAGLHLARLALAHQNDRQQVMAGFSGAHTYLREYFMESVLYRQPAEVQSFLFKTAILKHLTGSLCDAVTGQTDGTEMLDRLWQANLFLTRLEEPGWYRYHDLFAEMLNSQLQVQFPAEIPRLHRRAAEWYSARNAPADAVHHLLTIQAWEEAAALIEHLALRELEQSGEDSRLLRWLQQLPEGVVQQHKTLLFVYARLAGSALPQTEVDNFLTHVEANITRKMAEGLTPDEQEVLIDIRRLRQIVRTGQSLTMQLASDGKHEAVWQLLNGILLYQRYNCPDVQKAARLAREVYEAAQAQHNLFVILMAGGALAQYALLQGHLRDADRVARQVLQHALAQRGVLPEPASIALAALGWVAYERNQLAQAHQFLLRAAEVDPNPLSSNVLILIAIQRAKIELAQGQAEAAQATLQAARELQARRPSGLWHDQDLAVYQARLWLRQSDAASAEQILNEARDIEGQAIYMLVRAELLLQQQRLALAEELLNRLLQRYPHGSHDEPLMGARIMLAHALFEQHKVNEARRVMTEALRLATPEGFIRPFLDYAFSSVTLLALVTHTENLADDTHTFAREILRMLGQVDGAQESPSKAELLALTTVASISAREREVLRLVCVGLTNREIAARFSISESTVKTHLDNIYRKLGVNSRTQASVQAQILGLV